MNFRVGNSSNERRSREQREEKVRSAQSNCYRVVEHGAQVFRGGRELKKRTDTDHAGKKIS